MEVAFDSSTTLQVSVLEGASLVSQYKLSKANHSTFSRYNGFHRSNRMPCFDFCSYSCSRQYLNTRQTTSPKNSTGCKLLLHSQAAQTALALTFGQCQVRGPPWTLSSLDFLTVAQMSTLMQALNPQPLSSHSQLWHRPVTLADLWHPLCTLQLLIPSYLPSLQTPSQCQNHSSHQSNSRHRLFTLHRSQFSRRHSSKQLLLNLWILIHS